MQGERVQRKRVQRSQGSPAGRKRTRLSAVRAGLITYVVMLRHGRAPKRARRR